MPGPHTMTRINRPLITLALRVWLVETVLAGFNYLVPMQLIYQPRWGELAAHQIGMATRIVVIFILSYLMLRFARRYSLWDLAHIGILWLTLEEVMEWGGSLLVGRSVHDILVGWNVFAGYMWPYVMASYLLAPLIVGVLVHPGKDTRGSAGDGKTPLHAA